MYAGEFIRDRQTFCRGMGQQCNLAVLVLICIFDLLSVFFLSTEEFNLSEAWDHLTEHSTYYPG